MTEPDHNKESTEERQEPGQPIPYQAPAAVESPQAAAELRSASAAAAGPSTSSRYAI